MLGFSIGCVQEETLSRTGEPEAMVPFLLPSVQLPSGKIDRKKPQFSFLMVREKMVISKMSFTFKFM